MASSKRALEPSESEEESEEVYEVERILAQVEDEDGECLYLVKWKGYEDKECTWEPAESFQDPATLAEWKEKHSNGDFLPPRELDRVTQLMADFKAEQEKQDEERLQGRESKRRRLSRGVPSPSLSPPLVHKVNSSLLNKPKSTPTSAIRLPTPQDNPSLLLQPVFKPHFDLNKVVDSILARKAISTDTAMPNTAKRRRSSAGKGDRFRNLRHMNNVQKKASRADIAPQMTNLIAPSDLARREPAHILPPTAGTARPDSPLFFEESRSASPESIPQSPARSNLLANQAKVIRPEARRASDLEKANDRMVRKMTSRSGRNWSTDEVLVQLSLGDHRVGDVKLAGFPWWLRKLLINLKVGDNLTLHFQQDLVLTRQEFTEIAAEWPLGEQAYGEVHPFEDTKQACDDLATYFEKHDVAAVWAYPDVSQSSIVLILHSASLPTWRRAGYTALAADSHMPRLLVRVRKRSPNGQIPSSLNPPLALLPAMRPPMDASPILSVPPPNYSIPHVRNPLPTIQPTVTIPQSAPSKLSTIPEVPAPPKAVTGSVIPAIKVSPSKVAKEKPEGDDVENGQGAAQWKCDLDHMPMVKDAVQQKKYPFVYIAFGHHSPDQAQAVKVWCDTFTKRRFTFVEDTTTYKEWSEFCDVRAKDPGICLFSSEDPVYCKLPGLGHALGTYEDVSYFSLSWTRGSDPGHITAPHYTQTRLFPRGTVILLSEATLTQPEAAVDILRFFERHSKGKSKSWKLMLRPNVRAWLEHKALHAEDSEIGRAYLDLLVQVHKLSSVVDVTAIGKGVDKLRLLESMAPETDKPEEFIVPMPTLLNYDSAPSADDSAAAIAQRDEILLRHFVGWSITNAVNHRRFMAIDEDSARQGRDISIYDNAHHIVFQPAVQFIRNSVEKKNGSTSKKAT